MTRLSITLQKPNRCKHCKERMSADKARHVIHDDCIAPWLVIQNATKAAKQKREKLATAKVERANDKQQREKLKTLPVLKREAQTPVNAWIRERDKDQPCISCGKPPGDLTKLHAGRDAGHYRSVGAAAHLRYDTDNIHAQCVHCNQWGVGMAVEYRIGLIERIGIARVVALETNNQPHKWQRQELIDIRALYVQKLKELKAAKC